MRHEYLPFSLLYWLKWPNRRQMFLLLQFGNESFPPVYLSSETFTFALRLCKCVKLSKRLLCVSFASLKRFLSIQATSYHLHRNVLDCTLVVSVSDTHKIQRNFESKSYRTCHSNLSFYASTPTAKSPRMEKEGGSLISNQPYQCHSFLLESNAKPS